MKRHTVGAPCRICGGHEAMPRGQGKRCAGFSSDNGAWVNCERGEYAGDLRLDERTTPPTYRHYLEGPCHCGRQHGGSALAQNGRTHTPSAERRRIVATYNYSDASGRVLYRVARLEPKSFLPQHTTEAGTWVNGLEGVNDRVPYRLPELLAQPDRVAFWPEGEKDVERLAADGLLATTTHGGAKSFRKRAAAYAEHFRGRRLVAVLPDNDDDGRAYAAEVAASLVAVGVDVRMVELLGLPAKGDVSDWLDAGHTTDELKQLAKDTAPWQPPADRTPEEAVGQSPDADPLAGEQRPEPTGLLAGLRNGGWLDAQDFPPLRYAIPGLVPEGLSLIVGAPKIGKSWWALDTGLAVAAGGVALGRIPAGAPRPVFYLALEDSDRRLQDRCRQLLSGEAIPVRFEYMTRIESPGEIIPTLAAWLARHEREQPYVIIDTLGKVMPLAMQGESAYQRDYRITSELKQLCDNDPGATIGVNHHDRKAGSDDFVDFVSGTNGLAGGADTILVLSRDRGERAGLLRVTGRDVPEGEYALTLAQGCWWQLDGADLKEAAASAMTARAAAGLGDRSAAIIAYVGQHPEGVRADDVATALDMATNDARTYLARLFDKGRIHKQHRGLYTPGISVASVALEQVDTIERHTSHTNNTPVGAASGSAQAVY